MSIWNFFGVPVEVSFSAPTDEEIAEVQEIADKLERYETLYEEVESWTGEQRFVDGSLERQDWLAKIDEQVDLYHELKEAGAIPDEEDDNRPWWKLW